MTSYGWGPTSVFDLGILADGASITLEYDVVVHTEGTYDPACAADDYSGASGLGLRLNSACAGVAQLGDPFGLESQPIPPAAQFVVTTVPAPAEPACASCSGTGSRSASISNQFYGAGGIGRHRRPTFGSFPMMS